MNITWHYLPRHARSYGRRRKETLNERISNDIEQYSSACSLISWLQASRLQVSLAHLARVPVQEGLAAEHASELLGDTFPRETHA